MADPVLLCALALVAGAALALAPWPAALGAATVAMLLRRRARRTSLVLAVIALVIGGARARARIDGAVRLHESVVAVLTPPSRCAGQASVVGSPVVMHARGPSSAPGEARVDVELTGGSCGERPLAGSVRARLYGAPDDLARGDRLSVVADLAAIHLFLDEGERDPRAAIARSGIAASGGAIDVTRVEPGASLLALIDRFRARVRRRIDAGFHPDAAALARALVLGETDLDDGTDEAFRKSGLAHLLAVSGTHLILAVLGFTAAVRAVLVRVECLAARFDVGRLAAAIGIPAAWIYADFAGGGGSAFRAAGMLSAGMVARALGRRPSGARSFAWSLLVAALVDPLVACDISFALSAGSTAGLLLLDRPFGAVLARGPRLVRALGRTVATTLAAMSGCAPLLAVIAPGLPLLGIAANVIAAPIGELCALPLCLAHAVLAWAPPVERGAAVLGSGALLAVGAVARFTASAPGSSLPVPPPTPMQLAVLASALAATWTVERRSERVAALAVSVAAWGLLEVHAVREGSPRGRLRVSALDVGQGDSLLVDLPHGGAMLVDGGGFVGSPVDPGQRVLLPVLRWRRRTRLDVAVLSHPHPDHFGGLVSTLRATSVGELWDTGQGEAEGAGATYASLLRDLRARGVPIRRPPDLCGPARDLGGARVEVLAPCPEPLPDVGANDNSFVLRLTFGHRSALLVGDAEHDEEARVLRAHPRGLRSDLLKVGHHGSRTSTSREFLEAVSPSLAVISCGVRNRFGHPHPDTLATLDALGVPFLRTDRGGEVIWTTDGERVTVARP